MKRNKKLVFHFIFLITLGFVLGFWWKGSGPLLTLSMGSALISLGRLWGLLAAYFVLLQLVLIGRPRWLEPVFGLDRLSYIHHLNGTFLLFFILAHPLFLSLGYGMAGKVPAFSQLIIFIRTFEDVLSAAIALGLFVLIVALSYLIYINRKSIKYEWWYTTHLLTYVAIALAFSHQLTNGGDFVGNAWFTAYWYALYAFALGNILIFRFIKPAWQLQQHRFVVDKVQSETKDVTSIYITGKKMDKFKPQPGQFMIFRFLAPPFWWQAHPFSLSGRPDENHIRISIKNVGDFTSQVKNIKPGTRVLIDGPHGIFTKEAASKNKILLIAGGIGITPIRSLIEQLAKAGKNVILLYANRTQNDIAFKKELDDLSSQYCFPVYHILSQQPDYPGEKGYIDKNLIQHLVPDVSEREVYLCGPVPMMKKVVDDLVKLGVKRSLIHFEKFSL
jgi:predicted ferric reductase